MTTFTSTQIPTMTGRTVVITGANSGIGRAAARMLAAKGAHVVLAVRDPAKGRAAAATMNGDVDVQRLDLANLASVRSFAEDLTEPVDVLINNAGLMIPPLGRTADGFELQFGTSHLGHFALTNLLLPRIRERVVTVSSNGHRTGAIDFDDLNWERKPYKAFPAYAQSKLANLLFTAELQRLLTQAGSPVLAAAAHPGMAATNLLGHLENERSPLHRLRTAVTRRLSQSDDDGALPTLYARGGGDSRRQLRRSGRLLAGTRRAKARQPVESRPRRPTRPPPVDGVRGPDRRHLPNDCDDGHCRHTAMNVRRSGSSAGTAIDGWPPPGAGAGKATTWPVAPPTASGPPQS